MFTCHPSAVSSGFEPRTASASRFKNCIEGFRNRISLTAKTISNVVQLQYSVSVGTSMFEVGAMQWRRWR
eukprot:scaffold12580_cov58-Cylindrotheca_fusiformis.AAC.1